MVTLKNEESAKYSGGAKISTGIVIFITALSSFFLGLFDGFSNPQACNLTKK